MERSGFAVLGLGQFGQAVAVTLSRQGVPVVALDDDAERVDAVKDLVARAARVNVSEEAALRAAGVDEVACAVVAVGEHDFEASVICVLALAAMGVPRIVARAFSRERGEVLRRVGATNVVFPEEEAARTLAHSLAQPGMVASLGLPPGYAVAHIVVPRTMVGQTLQECAIRERLRVKVIAVVRNVGRRSQPPQPAMGNVVDAEPDTKFEEGDLLVVAGKTALVDALAREAV
jgi:trk system potassium uptake protein TrkA